MTRESILQKLALIGLAVLVVFAFAYSTAVPAPSESTGGAVIADKTCPKEGTCDACPKKIKE